MSIRTFALFAGLLVASVAHGAVPVATNIARFPSISVQSTNYSGELIVTNGVTIGGVRQTSWPAGGGGNLTMSGTPSVGDVATATDTSGTAGVWASVTGTGAVVKSTSPVFDVGITLGVGSAVLTNLAISGVSDPRTTNEVVLINHGAANTLALENTDQTGFSSITMRGADNQEYLAIGHGGTSTGAPIFNDINYIQSWGGTATALPKPLIITMDGSYGSGLQFFKRQSFETNGDIVLWKKVNYGATQVRGLTVHGNGRVTVGDDDGANTYSLFEVANTARLKLNVTPTDAGFQAFKDATPSKAWSIGLNNPGAGALSNGDIVFSIYNGSAWVEQARIANAGGIAFTKTITAGGTTGNQTIDKISGSVNFAGAAQSITVTDSLVTTSSVIMATVATDDSTAKSCIAVPGAGSFVLKLNAAATAETRVQFLVTN